VVTADVAVADCLNLPYRRGSCDAVLCIAVLHHISSPARRRRVLSQLLAILRPGVGYPPGENSCVIGSINQQRQLNKSRCYEQLQRLAFVTATCSEQHHWH
jgi:SAM-dependent methyltransferase